MHTAGPWLLGGLYHQNIYAPSNSGGDSKFIATLEADLSGPAYSQEQAANARLIAAAPELLEACKKGLTCSLDSSVRELIVKAIAKAEGR